MARDIAEELDEVNSGISRISQAIADGNFSGFHPDYIEGKIKSLKVSVNDLLGQLKCKKKELKNQA